LDERCEAFDAEEVNAWETSSPTKTALAQMKEKFGANTAALASCRQGAERNARTERTSCIPGSGKFISIHANAPPAL
jgi:hypothetical protein